MNSLDVLAQSAVAIASQSSHHYQPHGIPPTSQPAQAANPDEVVLPLYPFRTTTGQQHLLINANNNTTGYGGEFVGSFQASPASSGDSNWTQQHAAEMLLAQQLFLSNREKLLLGAQHTVAAATNGYGTIPSSISTNQMSAIDHQSTTAISGPATTTAISGAVFPYVNNPFTVMAAAAASSGSLPFAAFPESVFNSPFNHPSAFKYSQQPAPVTTTKLTGEGASPRTVYPHSLHFSSSSSPTAPPNNDHRPPFLNSFLATAINNNPQQNLTRHHQFSPEAKSGGHVNSNNIGTLNSNHHHQQTNDVQSSILPFPTAENTSEAGLLAPVVSKTSESYRSLSIINATTSPVINHQFLSVQGSLTATSAASAAGKRKENERSSSTTEEDVINKRTKGQMSLFVDTATASSRLADTSSRFTPAPVAVPFVSSATPTPTTSTGHQSNHRRHSDSQLLLVQQSSNHQSSLQHGFEYPKYQSVVVSTPLPLTPAVNLPGFNQQQFISPFSAATTNYQKAISNDDIHPTGPDMKTASIIGDGYGSTKSLSFGQQIRNGGGDRRCRRIPPSDVDRTLALNNNNDGDLRCKLCTAVLVDQADFDAHHQLHVQEAKPYACKQCPKRFAHNSYLSQHMRIHLGIRPYACDECGKTFTQLSHKQQHKRIHSGEKPYKCGFVNCNKSFSQLSNLQSHTRSHEKDRVFKCYSCYKTFDSNNDLLAHIPRHKTSKHLKVHICAVCGMSYSSEIYLSKHMTQKHSQSPTHVHQSTTAGHSSSPIPLTRA